MVSDKEEEIVGKFYYKIVDDMYVVLGFGDIVLIGLWNWFIEDICKYKEEEK